MIKLADIWAKKVAAEKRADAYSSLAKIIMKNPAKWGIKAEGSARPQLQAAARSLASNHTGTGPTAGLLTASLAARGATPLKPFGDRVFRATSSTPYGTSPTVQRGLLSEGVTPEKMRQDLLWVSKTPQSAFGNNMWTARAPKKITWRLEERNPVSAASGRFYKDISADTERAYHGPRKAVADMRSRNPAAPGVMQIVQQAERGNFQPMTSRVVREGYPNWESVVRRKDFPEASFSPVIKDKQWADLWRDKSGVPVYGNPARVTNLDFYKKTSAWLLREQ